jgi:hypothetical protein
MERRATIQGTADSFFASAIGPMHFLDTSLYHLNFYFKSIERFSTKVLKNEQIS